MTDVHGILYVYDDENEAEAATTLQAEDTPKGGKEEDT